MQRLARLFLVVLAALSFDSAAMSAQTLLTAADSASRAALLDSVAHARKRWEATRPPLYRVRIDLRCECARNFDNAPWVLVRADSILSDSVRADQRKLVMNRPQFYTVDRLFVALETALRDTLVTVADVHFDPVFGIPLTFSIRPRCTGTRCVAGGWTDIQVLDFDPYP